MSDPKVKNGPGDLESGWYSVSEQVRGEGGIPVAGPGDRYRVVRILDKPVLLDADECLVPARWWNLIVRSLEPARDGEED